MAINFSNENFVKISCNQVCSDMNDVCNLVSSDEIERQRGFLTESFIRPPVLIKIEFTKHNIDLMYIQLGLKVRNHTSRGIEIYAINNSNQEGQLIAKCHNPLQDKLVIVNNCYRPNRLLPQVESTFLSNAYTIAGRNIRHCSNIKFLMIKILSTLNSTVPCLGYLDIYGKPNGLQNDDLRQFCESLTNVKNDPGTSGSTTGTVPDNLTRGQIFNLSHQIEHLAPPEFFDAITHELMKNPFLLPSGKNIDKTCLNKMLETQSDCSPPCDPFTRLPFTDQSKPVLNCELKSRIDEFNCTNGQSEIDRRNELRRRLLNLP